MKFVDNTEDNNPSVGLLRCENCHAIYYTMDAFDVHTSNCHKEIQEKK